MKTTTLTLSLLAAIFASCQGQVSKEEKTQLAKQPGNTVKTAIGDLTLPPPYQTESFTNNSRVIGWEQGQTPKAPEGFTVTKFADGLENPRNTYIAPNGDIFVVESGTRTSKNQITIFQDKDKDGKFESRNVFISGLSQPYGMLVIGNTFYIANTEGVYRYAYKAGQTKLEGKGKKILDLPAGGYNNHWTRNLIASTDNSKIYVSVGSASNVGEYGMDKEVRRAAILEINPDGSDEQLFASGIRNPVGMDWNPITKELWTAVNERDGLGDDLVPDYITSVKRGGFYGWPYSYFGQIEDPRLKGQKPELVKKAIVPDVPVNSHTASLGIAFYTGNQFPDKYKNGAFVGQHGSWNRSKLSGYKVLFVPFKDGKPGQPEDFLTGFVQGDNSRVHGRPVDVTVMNDGSLLVNDDSGNTLWQISAKK
ncbi:sorbosone dehydrogenase family protein [Flavobacterium sp. MAH-1]|uniref:Sorbosone dehydrogenase family protein n=1 Tax=Flavobacterium agri TaxID=2743471 RepID=A0A7Y8Y3U8_9FLAO|nr:sorbosone dehydrogenase family protein [Flavobacterium agri]NUY80781.1 sorbosone dehydrogenase family protein [Flavobacterium agri]NYA70805.1 sorbosone dehydrogenase family protein [Flavobacterium agri]